MSLATMGPVRVRPVVDTWVDRTRALAARPEVAYVLVFENRGDEVGATIEHPHCQIYAFDQVPPTPLRELTGSCSLCRPPALGMVVSTKGAGSWGAGCGSTRSFPRRRPHVCGVFPAGPDRTAAGREQPGVTPRGNGVPARQ